MSDTMSEQSEQMKIIAEELAIFFKDEPQKITYWLFTESLHFGGISPARLILAGRAHKVAQFVLDAKKGNLP